MGKEHVGIALYPFVCTVASFFAQLLHERLCGVLQGAHVYVSGSADKMPHAVATAFEDMASWHAPSQNSIEKFVLKLQQTKRYHVEAWS